MLPSTADRSSSNPHGELAGERERRCVEELHLVALLAVRMRFGPPGRLGVTDEYAFMLPDAAQRERCALHADPADRRRRASGTRSSRRPRRFAGAAPLRRDTSCPRP